MTTLLDNEVIAVEHELRKSDTVRRKYGATLVSDGASGIDRKPFINLLLNSPAFTEFITQKYCSGEVKNAQYIAKLVVLTTSTLNPRTSSSLSCRCCKIMQQGAVGS